MKKVVLVINGAGGVGKDTLCELAADRFKIKNISSITPIKEIAAQCGWAGEKDDKARKFLSDLKRLTVEYNDFPTAWAMKRYEEFLASDEQIMFVHIREGEEIEKFIRATGGVARALLIRGGDRMTKSNYGNVSDDRVEDYSYDYYYVNDKALDVAKEEFCSLLNAILAEA